jgi:hypothetical protein
MSEETLETKEIQRLRFNGILTMIACSFYMPVRHLLLEDFSIWDAICFQEH